ncbi:MAG: TrmH family RNA methyltransferase [Pseudomonadota bacterium]
MRLVAYQPDIAGNVGALIRLAACFETPFEVIGPCGFPFSDKDLRRAAMDYRDASRLRLYDGWTAFDSAVTAAGERVVLLTTKGDRSHVDFQFHQGDVLLLGRESAGAPPEVHARAHARVRIPLAPAARSLNIAVAAAIVLGEALRQVGAFHGRTDGLSLS